MLNHIGQAATSGAPAPNKAFAAERKKRTGAERDIRGFAIRFYTEEGNWDVIATCCDHG